MSENKFVNGGIPFNILDSQDYGENWKRLIGHNQKAGILLIQIKKDSWEQIDNQKKIVYLTGEQAFETKDLEGSFFKSIWISKKIEKK